MRRRWWGGWLMILAACGGAPAAPEPSPTPTASASTAPAPPTAAAPALPRLRTGALEPESLAPVTATIIGRGQDQGQEVLVMRLPADALGPNTPFERPRVAVEVVGASGLAGVLEIGSSALDADLPPPLHVWVRRAPADEAPTVTLHVAGEGRGRGTRIPLRVEGLADAVALSDAPQGWRQAVGSHFVNGRAGAFGAFAVERLGGDPFHDAGWDATGPEAWAELMDLTTGGRSVRAALQSDTRLRGETRAFRPSVSMRMLTPPQLRRHDWQAMLGDLKRPVPDEPLAKATPAEFYFVRAGDLTALFALIDEADGWGTPLAHLVEGRSEEVRLSQRYRHLLGLPGGELSRVLGPKVVRRLAIVGSDPFLRQGSDLTLIADVESAPLFEAGLRRELAAALEGHGEPATTDDSHQGTPIRVVRSRDGAVEQHRARVGDLHLISNSPAALHRVLDAIAGTRDRLADEPDFAYMLARDAADESPVLAYAGDRFIEATVSPRSRILDARRQVALAELQRPAFAALLYGHLHGREPADRAVLEADKLLRAGDATHFDGSAITFAPGEAPRSAWGRPAHLTPLIDRPTPTRVTAAERRAYAAFVADYEALWTEALDPIALRVSPRDGGLDAHLRVLPMVTDRDYLQLQRLVGDGRLVPGPLDPGLRMTFSIGADSSLRRELTEDASGLLGGHIDLDWVGDYGVVGLLDEPSLAAAARRAEVAPELPADEPSFDRYHIDALLQAPLYVAVAVKNRRAAALLITGLRAGFARDVPFDRETTHHDVDVIRVVVDRELTFFYALSDHALYVSAHADVLTRLLDREQAGELPHAPAGGERAPGQLSFDARARPSGALLTVLHWLLEKENDPYASQPAAEALRYGAPSTTVDAAGYAHLALAYLGAIPFTVDGLPFAMTPHGATDPIRGDPFRPIFPPLPVAGSPASRVLDALESLRTSIAFDLEPPGARPPGARPPGDGPAERSLSVRVRVDRR